MTITKDDLPQVSISRLRASGVVTPAMTEVTIAFGDEVRTVGLAHTRFPNGGGWSHFRCPECGGRRRTLRLYQGRPMCWRCDPLIYRVQANDKRARIARLRALVDGGRATLDQRRPNRNLKRHRRALRRALIVERRAIRHGED
jgi:hypothetical protein